MALTKAYTYLSFFHQGGRHRLKNDILQNSIKGPAGMFFLVMQLMLFGPSQSYATVTAPNGCVAALTTNGTARAPRLRSEIRESELTLVPLRQRHFESLKSLLQTPDVNRFFSGGKSDPEGSAANHIRRAKRASGDRRETFDGQWAIEISGEFAGIIALTEVGLDRLPPEFGVRFPKEHPEDLYLSVGYALNPNFRGQGLASRSLNLVTEFARNTLGARYIFASTNALNDPSKDVLNRAGFEILPTSDSKRVKFFKSLSQ